MLEVTMVLCNNTEELGVASQLVGRDPLVKLSLGSEQVAACSGPASKHRGHIA